MNKIRSLILVIFSALILIAGIILNLLIIGWLDFETVFGIIQNALTQDPANKIILIITEFCMLFAILCIFADSPNKKESKPSKDVLMKNENGRLMISKETIENIVENVAKEFSGARQANTKIALDSENNVGVLVDLTVTKDVVIKELTLNMQNRIKEAIKKTSDLEVKEVNIRIKNIENPSTERDE